jgi:hypothetical protein
MRITEIFDEEPKPPQWMSYPIDKYGGQRFLKIFGEDLDSVPEILIPLYSFKQRDLVPIVLRFDSMRFVFNYEKFFVEVFFDPIENIDFKDMRPFINSRSDLQQKMKRQNFELVAPMVKNVMTALEMEVDPSKSIYGVRYTDFSFGTPDPYDDDYTKYEVQFALGMGHHMIDLLREWGKIP